MQVLYSTVFPVVATAQRRPKAAHLGCGTCQIPCPALCPGTGSQVCHREGFGDNIVGFRKRAIRAWPAGAAWSYLSKRKLEAFIEDAAHINCHRPSENSHSDMCHGQMGKATAATKSTAANSGRDHASPPKYPAFCHRHSLINQNPLALSQSHH